MRREVGRKCERRQKERRRYVGKKVERKKGQGLAEDREKTGKENTERRNKKGCQFSRLALTNNTS